MMAMRNGIVPRTVLLLAALTLCVLGAWRLLYGGQKALAPMRTFDPVAAARFERFYDRRVKFVGTTGFEAERIGRFFEECPQLIEADARLDIAPQYRIVLSDAVTGIDGIQAPVFPDDAKTLSILVGETGVQIGDTQYVYRENGAEGVLVFVSSKYAYLCTLTTQYTVPFCDRLAVRSTRRLATFPGAL